MAIEAPKARPGAWLALALSLLCASEGERLRSYADVGGVPTICDGETKDVRMGEVRTHEECVAMLENRIQYFADGVDRCTKVPLSAGQKAAFVDFAYNEGTGNYCKYLAPIVNAGRMKAACDDLLHFTTAGGKVYQGLVTRRNKERALCLT